MTSPADLPDDIDALKAIVLASQSKMTEQDGVIERKEDRIIRLEKLLADFKRALYGAKSEKGHPDQYHLALEDIETAMAVVHAEDEAIDPSKTTAAAKSRAGRGVLPKHLPRIEEIIAPEALTCGCGAERHIIGEDVSERLDIVPSDQLAIVSHHAAHGPAKLRHAGGDLGHLIGAMDLGVAGIGAQPVERPSLDLDRCEDQVHWAALIRGRADVPTHAGNMASDRIGVRDVGETKTPARVILQAQFFNDVYAGQGG
jgi:hypothetical protein